MSKKNPLFLAFLLIGLCAGTFSGCDNQDKKLVVYSGKGLERVMEEVRKNFEDRNSIQLEMIYAGSDTLLSTITKTRIGDVFIPGSVTLLDRAGDLVHDHRYVAMHTPVFAARKDNRNNIKAFDDLLRPGMKLATGNRNMCAIGSISDQIITASAREEEFARNLAITGATVNELLNLVVHGEVDASLIWGDMMMWPEAEDLFTIDIPQTFNKPKKIHIAVLSTSTDKQAAERFVQYVATEGKSIFKKHGFGE